MTSTAAPAPRRLAPGAVLVALAVLALVADFLWTRSEAERVTAEAGSAAAGAQSGTPGNADAASGTRPLPGVPAGMPPGARYEGGILVDAQGQRILNAAGLPIGPPPPPAPPVRVKAAPNEVVGYTTDARGVTRPLLAKDAVAAQGTPGTYVVVDMWAEGGPAVVAPTEGRRLTDAEANRLRAEEAARDRRPTTR